MKCLICGEQTNYTIDVFSKCHLKVKHPEILHMKDYKELPRKPRPLAAGMNWQNNCKNHLANSKYDR